LAELEKYSQHFYDTLHKDLNIDSIDFLNSTIAMMKEELSNMKEESERARGATE
jgi:uncharacterized small protein (DUF1192 family)